MKFFLVHAAAALLSLVVFSLATARVSDINVFTPGKTDAQVQLTFVAIAMYSVIQSICIIIVLTFIGHALYIIIKWGVERRENADNRR